jgi:hypothetical protein
VLFRSIFVVEFLIALSVLMTWKSGYYGLSSSEARNTPLQRYRMPQEGRHGRGATRRQRKRHGFAAGWNSSGCRGEDALFDYRGSGLGYGREDRNGDGYVCLHQGPQGSRAYDNRI